MSSLPRSFATFFVACGLLLSPAGAGADARFDALVQHVAEHVDYRARAAAALVLGTSRDARAAEPLCKALKDDHALVRMSAAAALGRLGRGNAASCLDAASNAERDDDVKRQIARSLTALRGPGGSTAKAHAPPPPGPDAKYYVVLRVINKTDRPPAEVDAFAREEVQLKVLEKPTYAIAPKDADDSASADVAKQQKLRVYTLDVTIEAPVADGANMAETVRVAVGALPVKGRAVELVPRHERRGVAPGDARVEDELLRSCIGEAVESFEKIAEAH